MVIFRDLPCQRPLVLVKQLQDSLHPLQGRLLGICLGWDHRNDGWSRKCSPLTHVCNHLHHGLKVVVTSPLSINLGLCSQPQDLSLLSEQGHDVWRHWKR